MKGQTLRPAAGPPRLVASHQGALGDFLLLLPVLEGLAQASPGLRIDLWIRPEFGTLCRSKSFIGAVHSSDGAELTPFFQADLWRHAPVPEFFLDASAVLIFGQASSRLVAERLARRLNGPVYWVRSFPAPDDPPCPVSRFLADQVRVLGWPVVDVVPAIAAPPDARAFARRWLESVDSVLPPILIHPGSGGRRKIWPFECWLGLLRWLRAQSAHPVLLSLGPADEGLRSFAEQARPLVAHLVEGFSLTQLAALLAECALYVGSDSGVSHLAPLTGCPAVVIFGPTDPRVWAPQGPRVRIICSSWEGLEDPSPPDSSVLQAVAEQLALLSPRDP